jgi:hypothetical protein
MREPFEDAVLGRVAWNTADGCWRFDAGPVSGWSVRANVAFGGGELAESDWEQVRECVRWVRANDPSVRAELLARIGERTEWGTERRPVLSEVIFVAPGEALLQYGGCSDAVWWVRVNPGGVVGAPLRFASADE